MANEIVKTNGNDISKVTDDDPAIIQVLQQYGTLDKNQVIKVLAREVRHLTELTHNLDNEHRAYLRKNLPRNPDGAKPHEVELIFAEQRFIKAAKNCAELIGTGGSDRVVEFALALANLEKNQSRYPELLGVDKEDVEDVVKEE